MEKTLESIFIKQYEDLQNELFLSKKKIEELESLKKEQIKIDVPAVEAVVFTTFSKECCYLTVCSDYNIIQTTHFKDLTSTQVKEIIEDDKKLREYAQLKDDHYEYASRNELVHIQTKAFPYSTVIQSRVILLDIYDYNNFDVNAHVLYDKNKLQENRYFDIKEKNKLYEFGLKKLKKELQNVYEKKLKEEAKNE